MQRYEFKPDGFVKPVRFFRFIHLHKRMLLGVKPFTLFIVYFLKQTN